MTPFVFGRFGTLAARFHISNGDVIRSVNPDARIKGQRSAPRGERRITSLSALLGNWLTDLLSAEPLAAQRALLAPALRLIALPGRRRDRQRRRVRKAHPHLF